MKTCEVCRGRKTIRLPVYRPASVSSFSSDQTPSIGEASYRDYPCPECGDQVKLNRVAILDVHTIMEARHSGPDYLEHGKKSAAFRLVDELLRGDFITFEQGPPDVQELSFPIVASLGVVSKGQVATLEQRISQRQDQVARVVASEAKKQIANWGSYYGDGTIQKGNAYSEIDSALNKVLADWSKTRFLKNQDH